MAGPVDGRRRRRLGVGPLRLRRKLDQGSREKIDALARRIEMGVPLWHPEDRNDYSGLTGAVRPRE